MKSFAVTLLFFFHRVVLLTGELAGVEPLAPPVRPLDKLDAGVERDRIYRHPDTEHPAAIHWVVGLVVVPGRRLLCPWQINQMLLDWFEALDMVNCPQF